MLTPDERAKVQQAYAEGFTEDFVFRDGAQHWRQRKKCLEAVVKAWSALTDEERFYLGSEIADPLDVEKDIEWGIVRAARRLIESSKGEPGKPPQVPGLRRVVRELFLIWVNRGNPPEVGQLRRETARGSLHPYPALEFVADEVTQVIPDVFANTREPKQRRDRILKAVDSQLRALRELEQIPR